MTPDLEVFELDWLERWSMYTPKATALKCGDSGRQYSYQKLFQLANNGAHFLTEKYGIKKGDGIACLSTNELEYVVLFFSLQRIGATLIPINFRLTPREVSHILEDATPSLILAQEEFAHLVGSGNIPILHLTGPMSFACAIERAERSVFNFRSEAETPALILYTSGTTGSPKGAVLSHRMLFWNSINTTMRLNISSNDCAVIFLPLFHTGGWNVLTTPILHRGGKIVLQKKFDAGKILQLCESESATILFGVPTTMDMMAREPNFEQVSLKSLRYAIVGGEPMPIPLIKTWDKKGIPIRQGYGLTEFGPNVFSLNEQDAIRKIGSIGFPNFYIKAKIVDERGTELSANQIGELVLSGPMSMTCYWQNPTATAETVKEGWLYTGDLVKKDDEGYYYVVGRKKDMFISGGENVYPVEIEQVLQSHPNILEVAVIGVPDAKWGEVGKAFVVTKSAMTLEEISQFCQQNLARFKIPRHFEFMASLPKGDSGKILKKNLRQSL